MLLSSAVNNVIYKVHCSIIMPAVYASKSREIIIIIIKSAL